MNITLIEPNLEEYWYEQKLLSDPKTMEYNIGYEISNPRYHYDTGFIDFPKELWAYDYEKRKDNFNHFFDYIKDLNSQNFVGYVFYSFNESKNRYE